MPRKKKTIVEETLPDDAPDTGDLADVICVLSKVYKLNSGGKSFCFQTTEPVDEVYIQAQYPTGGKFIVLEYNTLNQVMGTTHIDIEPKPLSVVPIGNGGDLQSRMLLDELSFTRTMMLKMIEGLTSGRTQQANTPIGELAQAMQVVNEMSSKSNPVDLIVKGMELGIQANGGAPDWKAQLAETAKQIIPAFVAKQQTVQISQGQQPMIQTTPVAMIKQGIDWLKPKILSGMTVDLAIGWVIQNANDPTCNQLIANAIKGDVNTFIEFDPELANEPYRTWFETAIQLLKDEYAAAQQQQGDNTDDHERGDRDRSDIASHENAGAGKSKIAKIG